MNELDVNRMILLFEKAVREVNREEINPKIPELKLDDLHPVIRIVAQSRARYLKELFDIASLTDSGETPSYEQIKKLEILQKSYETLVKGSKAVEVAIERGYLDIDV